jgi:histidine ammonia-lyase
MGYCRPRVHDRSAQADIAIFKPRIHSPVRSQRLCWTNSHPRPIFRRPQPNVSAHGRTVRDRRNTLTLEAVERLATDPAVRVALAEGARERIVRSRAVVERALERGDVVYGLTTGFGRLAETIIDPARLEELQLNLIRSHACGFGPPLSRAETRAITLLRANVLAKGFSGVRPVVVERLLDLLNHGVHPVIPEQGSVGASGDLAPLSHLALVLVGEGEAEHGGEVMPGGRRSGGRGWSRCGCRPRRGWRSTTAPSSWPGWGRSCCAVPSGRWRPRRWRGR